MKKASLFFGVLSGLALTFALTAYAVPVATCYDGSSYRDLACNSSGQLLTSSGAAATSMSQAEVLVLNSAATAVPTSALSGRQGVEIQNLGPNAIFCSGGTPVVNKARRVDQYASVFFPVTDAVTLKCIAATADQVTAAATIVTEVK